MRTFTTLAAAAAIAVTGAAATAGGLEPSAMDKEIIVVDPMPTGAGGTVPAGYIVLGVLAALVAASGSF